MSILSVYATNKSLLQLTKQDIGKLNILNVGFGILEQGEISLKNLTYIHAIREFKVINPNLKIYLSLASGLECSFSTACRTKEAREKVIRSIVALIKEWDFDGIDIDWEYPSGKKKIDIIIHYC